MITTSLTQKVLSLSVLVAIAMSATPLHAQSNTTDSVESIDLLVGDILEILPATTSRNAQYVWVLTKDGEYVESARTAVFRKRIIQPGTYSLYAEISADDMAERISKTFELNYSPRTPGTVDTSMSGSGQQLVQTKPALVQQAAILGADRSLVQVIPTNLDQTPIVLDTNTEFDSDEDGRADNDADSQNTFFQTDATPLYVWFADSTDRASMNVTAIGENGDPIIQSITVLSKEAADAQGIASEPVEIQTTPEGDGLYKFSAVFTSGAPSVPLLYTWEFGDGQQSLLTSPTHGYNTAGEFAVKLTIKNLSTGTEIATATKALQVDTPASGGVASEPTDSSNPSTENPTTESGSGSLLKYMLLGLVFFIFVAIGFGVMFVISRIRKKGDLSKSLASMEETFLKPDAQKAEKPTISIAPAPKAAPAPEQKPAPAEAPTKEQVAEKEKEHTELKPSPEKEAVIQEKNAPAWLKGGLTGAQAQKQSAPTPAQSKPATPAPTPQVQTSQQDVSTPKPQQPTPARQVEQKPMEPKPAPPAAPQAPKPQQPTPAPQAPKQTTPIQPKPQQSNAKPAWLSEQPRAQAPKPQQSQPAAPTPAQPASAKAAPTPPKPQQPTPAPQVEQKPMEPKPAPPAAPQAPKPTVEPQKQVEQAQMQPKPQAPTTPEPQKPRENSTQAKPVVISEQKAPETPTPKVPEEKPIEPASVDEPVAYIRADSLEQKPIESDKKEDSSQNPPSNNAQA